MAMMKAVFIGLYPLLLVGLTLWSLLSFGGPWQADIAWLSVLFMTVPMIMTFASWLIFKRVARTRRFLKFPLLLLGIGVGANLAAWISFRFTTATCAALLALLGYVLYETWYTSLPHVTQPRLIPGERLPPFTLETLGGQKITRDQVLGQTAIFIFFRGNWCPFCVAQVREVAALYRKIQRRGAAVFLVSSQPAIKTAQLARRFNVSVHFLVDRENRQARDWGLAAPFGLPLGLQLFGYDSETVLPTTLIVDARGIVRYLHRTEHYRIRPEPQTLLSVLERLGG